MPLHEPIPNRLPRLRQADSRPSSARARRSGTFLARAGVALVSGLGLLAGCSPRSAESPGIPLGSPGISWAAKNNAQRFGFMAAQVHPVMSQLFQSYNADNYAGFTCSNCHGDNMEQIDYRMPNQALYSMPEDRAYDDAMDFDEEIAVFMMTKVTPTLQDLFNRGEGPPTKVTCFNCHPKYE